VRDRNVTPAGHGVPRSPAEVSGGLARLRA
jgi:hypothetical protein